MLRLFISLVAALACLAAASAASAADMPVKAPVIKGPVAAAPNWTGFYIGANAGGGWGNRSVNFTSNDPVSAFLTIDSILPPLSFKTSGALGGLQFGYNWQFNRNWLVGVEADFDWSGIKGSVSKTFSLPGGGPSVTSAVDEQVKWLGTVRARLGYLAADNLLAYVTGGFAYARVDHSGSYVNNSGAGILGVLGGFGFFCAGGATCFNGSSSNIATGWTAGGGLEYAVWKSLSVKAEYLYVSLDGKSATEIAPPFGIFLPVSFNTNFSRNNLNIARVGVNYRF